MAFVLYVLAAVAFGVALLPMMAPYRVHCIATGLLMWVLVPLLTTAGVLQ